MLPFSNINGVRLATLEDLDRISVVAASAFFWSPTFRFQRPYYRDFPADTIASYRIEYERAISDPACVVIVAEDVLESDEAEHVYEALRYKFTHQSPILGQESIVGVCSFTLKPDLHAANIDHPRSHRQVHSMKRDQCLEAMQVYESVTGPPKQKHIAGKMRLSTLAVSPRYWRRGHASCPFYLSQSLEVFSTRLVRFCVEVADADEAVLGISATAHGALVAAKAGFEECETIHINRLAIHDELAAQDSQGAADVVLWIGVRLPCSRPPSTGNASSSESPKSMQ